MSEYIQFKAEQVEHAKRHLLCQYLQERVDKNELNLLEAIEEQMCINTVFATGREEMESGNYQPVTPDIFAEIQKRSQSIKPSLKCLLLSETAKTNDLAIPQRGVK